MRQLLKKLHGIINSYRDNLRWLMFCLKLWWTFQISLTVFVFAFSKCGLNIPHKSVLIFYKLRNMIYDDCLWCDLFVIIWFFKNHINFAGYCSILRYSLFIDWLFKIWIQKYFWTKHLLRNFLSSNPDPVRCILFYIIMFLT